MSGVLVHVGYSLMLCAFVARDILWLRGTLVVAQALLAAYAWRLGVQSIAAWNVVFVCINIIWVARILRERRAVTLPEEIRELYERHFFALSRPEFLSWWRQGRLETLRDAKMTRLGGYPEALYFLLSGSVRVSREGEHITDLPAGHFIGEMSLITGKPATADVVAIGTVDVVKWPIDELKALQTRNPVIWTRIQSAIGQDLVIKIARDR